MAKTKSSYILTLYKVRNRATGLFRVGGMRGKYSKTGKSWSSKGALKGHIVYNRGIMYLINGEWKSNSALQGTYGWYYSGIQSRRETDQELIARTFSPDDEVIEILVSQDLSVKVTIYSVLDFMSL
jgi:hypothetical protein